MNTKIIIVSCILLLLLIAYIVYKIITTQKEKEKEKEKEKDDEKLVKSMGGATPRINGGITINGSDDPDKKFKVATYKILSEGMLFLGALAVSDFIIELINSSISNKNKKLKLLIKFIVTIILIAIAILTMYLLDVSL